MNKTQALLAFVFVSLWCRVVVADGVLNTVNQTTTVGGSPVTGISTTNNSTLSANVVIGNGARGVVNGAASGAVPVNADGSASTFPLSNSVSSGGYILWAIPQGTNAASGNAPLTLSQSIGTDGTNSEIIWNRGWNAGYGGTMINSNFASLQEVVEMNWDPATPSNSRQIEYYFNYNSRSNLFGNRPFGLTLRDTDILQANFSVDNFHLDGAAGNNDNALVATVSRTANGGADITLHGSLTLSNNAVNSGGLVLRGSAGLTMTDPNIGVGNFQLFENAAAGGFVIDTTTNVTIQNTRLWTWINTNDFQGNIKFNGNDMRLVNAKDLILGGANPTDGNYTSIRGNAGNDTILSRAYTAFTWTDTHSGSSGGAGVTIMNLNASTGNLTVKGSTSSTNGFGSYAVSTITTSATGATNTTGVNQYIYVTAATSATLKDNAGTTEFSGVTIVAFTPIRLQPAGTFVGTSITYATGTSSHAE